MIVDRYYYNQLNKQEQAVYKAFYNGLMAHEDVIPIPIKGQLSKEVFNKIFRAMTRDNPLIYYVNQSACNWATDAFGHTAICPQYFYSRETVRKYNRNIENAVNNLAAQLKLTEGTDYEKEVRVHDWFCKNVKYDFKGADMDEPARVVLSHNIIGVFAKQKAQCEGIAKAVKVLLNAVDINFAVFNRYLFPGQLEGFFFTLFAIAIAAAETAVAIAIIINIYRNLRNIEVKNLDELKD